MVFTVGQILLLVEIKTIEIILEVVYIMRE